VLGSLPDLIMRGSMQRGMWRGLLLLLLLLLLPWQPGTAVPHWHGHSSRVLQHDW
jgi:hypothetical protein